jgi:tripeptidyl-peptidase-1
LVATPEDFPGTVADELSTCDEFITPACIRSLYNVPEISEYPKTGPRVDNSMGVFEEGDFYSPKDLGRSYLSPRLIYSRFTADPRERSLFR